MTEPFVAGAWDHLLAVVIVVVLPLFGIVEFRQMRASLAAGSESARLFSYRLTIGVLWALTIAIAAAWLHAGRPLVGLGLGFGSGAGQWAVVAATTVIIVLALWQNAHIMADADRRASAREEIEPVADLMPTSAHEYGWFVVTSITAGVCEEIVYRGFLIQYLLPALGPWSTAGLTALVFGLGHAYQGWLGVLKTGVFGLLMAALVLISGNLWAAVVLHAAIDLISGRLGWELVRDGADS